MLFTRLDNLVETDLGALQITLYFPLIMCFFSVFESIIDCEEKTDPTGYQPMHKYEDSFKSYYFWPPKRLESLDFWNF